MSLKRRRISETDLTQHEDDSYNFILELLQVYTKYKMNFLEINTIMMKILEWVVIEIGINTQLELKCEQTEFDMTINSSNKLWVKGNVKGFNRMLTKTILEYNSEVERCCDIVRYTVYLPPEIKTESFIENLKIKFNMITYNEDYAFKLCKIKDKMESYFISQWICILDKDRLQDLVKQTQRLVLDTEHKNKKKELDIDSKDEVMQIPDEVVRYMMIRDREMRRSAKPIDILCEAVYCGTQGKPNKFISPIPDGVFRFRFEIQFKFKNTENDHFEYEWKRLTVVNNTFQHEVQKTIINEMLEKCKRSPDIIKEKYLKRLQELYGCSDLITFNQKLLKFNDKIIDFI